MRFTLQREAFLKPLAQVVNVVERRQTQPVLANFLVQVQDNQLSLTGTDLEVEMVARTAVDDAQDGETTIPARKLFEIVRALPDGSRVNAIIPPIALDGPCLSIRKFRKDMLQSSEPVGRKLDFLIQEVNRECNTIGSKCNDLTVARDVVNMKAEVEKIREQVQNME